MCIAKLQMRKSRHIPGGSSFVTAEVKKNPRPRPPEKDAMNGKRACRHTQVRLFLYCWRTDIYVCAVPSSLFMLIFFGKIYIYGWKSIKYSFSFPPFIMLSIRHLLDLNQQGSEIKRRPAAASGQTRLVGRLQLYDLYTTFFSFLKNENDEKTLAIDAAGRHLTGMRLDESWRVRSQVAGGMTTSQKSNSIA